MRKLGIIGYGKIGAEHQRVFEALGAQVVCSANRSEQGKVTAREAGIDRQYADYAKMIQKEDIDAVICSSSLFSNYAIARDVISAGIPLLLEKPPGTSELELQDLISTQARSNSLVQVATNRVWYSVFDEAIEILGGLRNLESISMEWSENPKRLMAKRGFTKMQVMNRNYSNTIHAFSILNKFAGRVRDPQTTIKKGMGDFDYEMLLQGISDKGVAVQFLSSWSNPIPWSISLNGQGKYIRFAPLEKAHVKDLSLNKSWTIEGHDYDKTYKPGFYAQARHFLSILNGEKQNELTTLKAMQGLFEYARNLTPTRND